MLFTPKLVYIKSLLFLIHHLSLTTHSTHINTTTFAWILTIFQLQSRRRRRIHSIQWTLILTHGVLVADSSRRIIAQCRSQHLRASLHTLLICRRQHHHTLQYRSLTHRQATIMDIVLVQGHIQLPTRLLPLTRYWNTVLILRMFRWITTSRTLLPKRH